MKFSRGTAISILITAFVLMAAGTPANAAGSLGIDHPTNLISRCRTLVEESFWGAVASEAINAAGKTAQLVAYKASRGKLFAKDFDQYLGPDAGKIPEAPVNFDDVSPVLAKIDKTLRGNSYPELRLKNKVYAPDNPKPPLMYDLWLNSAQQISAHFGVDRRQISEYVIFVGQEHYAFIKSPGQLTPIHITTSEDGASTAMNAGTAFQYDHHSPLSEEMAVRKYAEQQNLNAQALVRRMTAVTNDMQFARDRIFEWEGSLVASLRRQGGWRAMPKIQALIRGLYRVGINLSAEGRLTIEPEIENELRRAYTMAFPEDSAAFNTEINRSAERYVYHTLIKTFLEQNPKLVTQFLDSDFYRRRAPEFIDRHIAYVGATYFDIAKGMLAGEFLFQFEKRFQQVSSAKNSYSQHYLADAQGYHDEITSWLASANTAVPSDIASLTATLNRDGNLPLMKYDKVKIKTLVAESHAAMNTVAAQIARHDTHNWFTDLAEKAGFITDKRQGAPNNIIANLALAKAEGVYTLAAFLDPSRVDGYLGPEIKGYEALPDFKPSAEVPSTATIQRALTEIVKSETFAEQTKKIAKYAPDIAAYLAHGENVPAEVREFAQTLFSEKFAAAVYQKLGGAYDPNSMNRFFPDGFHDFQKMNMYRYIFDLAHGLTSVLVRDKLSPVYYLERVFAARWRRYDFTGVSDVDMQNSLTAVLKAGQDRIAFMHNMPIDDRTPVAYRESIEVFFGINAYNTKFLRWKKYWDEWELMGGGWNCICFVRKSIFNPFSIRQF